MQNVPSPLAELIAVLATSFDSHSFVKLSMGNYKGGDGTLKQMFVKPVEIKKERKLAFTLRHKTRDLFKNLTFNDGVVLIEQSFQDGFNIITLFTQNEEFILERNKKGVISLRKKNIENPIAIQTNHDKQKKRLISAEHNVYLQELGLTDFDGQVFKRSQDKYKQINQYIEILSTLLKEFPTGTVKKVADMGSGKGYLTFALYDYLKNNLQEAEVVGVEFRKDMVALCNSIARKASFEHLQFVEGTIDSYDSTGTNLLMALHACDTATDDAIYKGIKANAELIVVAPCCHKQIRRQMEKAKAVNELSATLKYGLFLERQAEMITDSLRTMILNANGYKTKVLEFVSDAHTAKNVLIVASKYKNFTAQQRQDALQKIAETKAYFGIREHHLENLLGI